MFLGHFGLAFAANPPSIPGLGTLRFVTPRVDFACGGRDSRHVDQLHRGIYRRFKINAARFRSRRREAAEVLGLLVDDPALVSRSMVEDVLRYKRLDGVSAALAQIAEAWFAGGRQSIDLTNRIAALTMPVQLVWGRNDRIIPVAHAEALAARMPVHIIESAGHLPHMEKAGEVNRLIGQFIGG